MAYDYYSTLGVDQSANLSTLTTAYKTLAARYHPSRQESSSVLSKSYFKLIAEAYQVLSNKYLRVLYGKFGKGEAGKPWAEVLVEAMSGNTFSDENRPVLVTAEELFKQVFGVSDISSANDITPAPPPKRQRPNEATSIYPGAPTSWRNRNLPKDPDKEMVYSISLEDLYKGVRRRLKLTHTIIDKHSGTPVRVSELKEFVLRPGTFAGTKVRFENAGDETPGRIPADVVLVVHEKPHSCFVRKVNDLVATYNISLPDALTGTTLKLTCLDGKELAIPITEVVKPGYTKRIAEAGMPLRKSNSRKFGDLLVNFQIMFPQNLLTARKEEVRKLLTEQEDDDI
ncbi:hypothetical protein NDN08_001380 [Rhodosorus marinus]|uniref:J domain-containing protein n=1 Tax=Rhodosorus marinus TaxID=101924 RepID=A0AAV8UQQ6_9RHOD|nr:hypothetical protein NDN08_001380 [Rhodosorus marinus]